MAFVLYETAMYDEPKVRRFWYPTGIRAKVFLTDYKDLIGEELEPEGRTGGEYRFVRRNDLFPFGNGPKVTLPQRGATVALFVEEVDVPPPEKKLVRGRSLRWNDGLWEVALKSGWKPLPFTAPP